MAVNQQRKAALKRLKADLDELTRSPVAGIAAAPLENDMLEWHCNILLADVTQHLILFFPEEYPCKPPSAEFVPRTFTYGGGATMPGKKGTQICMPMFSDYEHYHREWEKQAVGWSPGYTVQTCLLNALSFLSEYSQQQTCSTEDYTCPDCGHSNTTPYPRMRREASILAQSVIKKQTSSKAHLPIPRSQSMSIVKRSNSERTYNISQTVPAKTSGLSHAKNMRRTTSEMTYKIAMTTTVDLENNHTDLCEKYHVADYISKGRFRPELKPISNCDIYGYSLALKSGDSKPIVTSPCEVISAGSFYLMKESRGFVHSITKQELTVFLPLYLCSNHASGIKDVFEQAVNEIWSSAFPDGTGAISISERILKIITVLLGNLHQVASSDSRIQGSFAIHRLLLWAVDIYSDLLEMLEYQLQDFIESADLPSKKSYPDIRSLPMLVTLSKRYRWNDIAKPYLSAFWQHQLRKFLKWDYNIVTPATYRETVLREISTATVKSRGELAVQVAFLGLAMPGEMSRDDVVKRYDGNLGFPTDDMVAEMKNAIKYINKLEEHAHYDGNYTDWFDGILDTVSITDILKKIPVSKENLNLLTLCDSCLQRYFAIHHLLLCAIKTYFNQWQPLETRLKGYYWIRRILLWVVDTSTDLLEKLESQIQECIESTDFCSKSTYTDIRSLLMLVAASKRYKWQDIAKRFMSAFWHHQLNEFLKVDNTCGKLTRKRKTSLRQTLNATIENRKQLEFQVCFLSIVMQQRMSQDDFITQNDVELGFPTNNMVSQMKNVLQKFEQLDSCANYANWFNECGRILVSDIPEPIQVLLDNLLLAWLCELSIQQYFTIHYLLLLAVASDYDMQEMLDNRIKDFIDLAESHSNTLYPGLQTLMLLLTVSDKYRWQDISKPYMTEFWRRQATEYVKRDTELGVLETDVETRLRRTHIATLKTRKQLAFQVCFLDIVMPRGLSRDDVIARYDGNLGCPTDEMVAGLTTAIQNIDKLESCTQFANWFILLNLELPSDNELFEVLKDSIHPRIWCVRRSGRSLSKRKVDMSLSTQRDKTYKVRR